MPFSSSPPNGGLVRMTSTRSFSPISVSLKRSEFPESILRRIEAVQQQVHLAQQVRQRLGLAADDRASPAARCRCCTVLTCAARCVNASTRKPPVPAAGSSTVSPSCGSMRSDHEPHHRPRRVELAGVPGRVAHLPQHRLVQRAQRVQLVAGREVNAGDLVDDVAQQVTALHAVIDALEHGRDHVAAVVAVGAGEASQVGEQARALACRRAAWSRPG